MGSACCFRIIDFLAMFQILLKSSVEGCAQLGQQFLSFLIGGSGGADADIHTTDLVHLVVLDFGEDQLFLQAECVVAAAVEGEQFANKINIYTE